jgi:catalase
MKEFPMKNGSPAAADDAIEGPVEEARNEREARRPQRSGDAFGERDGGVEMIANEYGRAADRYREMSDRERDDLVRNLIGQLAQCGADVRERMLGHLEACDRELGQRVAGGIRMMRSLVDVSV